MTVIEKRTDKIEAIDDKLNALTSKVCSLEKELTTIKAKTHELEASAEGISNLYDKVQKTCNAHGTKIQHIQKDIKDIKDVCNEYEADRVDGKSEIEELRERMLDLQCRSMKYNLIFSGITENHEENTEEEIRKFFKEELGLEDDFKLENVHRFGLRRIRTRRRKLVPS